MTDKDKIAELESELENLRDVQADMERRMRAIKCLSDEDYNIQRAIDILYGNC